MLGSKRVRKTGNSVMGNCPFAPYLHDDGYDRKPSFGILIDRTSAFHCFGCGVKGRLMYLPTLLSYYSGEYNQELARFINDNDLSDDYCNDITESRTNHALIRTLFYTLPPAEPHIGLTKEDITMWEIKYDKEKNSLVFPVYDLNNNLVALKGRNLTKKSFFYYDGSSSVKKDGLWYGMNRTSMTRRKIVLCEGERDVIFLSRKGVTAWGCLGSLSKEQITTIKKSPNAFVLFFDNDSSGESMRDEIIKQCKLFNELYVIADYSGYKDPADVVRYGKLMKALTSMKPVDKNE